MSQSAFIKLVEGSEAVSLDLDEVKAHFHEYKEQTTHTGQQLDWSYEDAAFPYTIETKPEGEGKWFYLKGTEGERYRNIVIGIGSEDIEAAVAEDEVAENENADETEDAPAGPVKRHFIQIVLPEGSTHGDKAKGNEFCKYLGKKLKAEVHLFNGRVMYFNPRK